jgi:hypothetical protein
MIASHPGRQNIGKGLRCKIVKAPRQRSLKKDPEGVAEDV